jgi:2-polyprenyl-3-methyl-5-hydroxy-6-metoxy-1,4-benzoquinol methylase
VIIGRKMKSLCNKIDIYNINIIKGRVSLLQVDPDLKHIINSLLINDFENFVAGYSQFCIKNDSNYNDWRNKIRKHISKSIILKRIRSSKSRYYESFLSLFDNLERRKIEKILYPGINKYISDIRSSLSIGYDVDFFKDRILEWMEIFGEKVIPYVTKDEMYKRLNEFDIDNDRDLFTGLSNIMEYYFLRKMQMPTLSDFERYFRISKLLSKSSFRVLDYGCGAADLSIYLAKKGNSITLCDIKDGNLQGAVKRFGLRNMKADYLGVDHNNPLPEIKGKYDLIILIEVLEHVRYPFDLLELLDSSMHKGGIIMLGSFPFIQTVAIGDHLKEAVDKRDELNDWINKKWVRISNVQNDHTFIKKY